MNENRQHPIRTRNRPSPHPDTIPAIAGPWLSRRLRGACATLIVLLAGMAIAFSASGQPASPSIRLEVQNHASSGSDGFTNTTASDGATFSYRYSGGEGNGGDVIFRTRGKVTVNVHLADGTNYAIDDVSFTGDIHRQLSWVSNARASSTAVIQDRNDRKQEARYKVTVRTSSGSVTIPCDPIMANR